MLIKQISVFVENKKGRLSLITNLLAENKINIRALSIADTTDYGILRLIVNDPEKAVKALKDEGLTASLTNVVAINVDDTPGGLAKSMKVLLDNNISVEYMYAFHGGVETGAVVILRVDDNEKTIAAFEKSSVALLSSEKVYG